MPKLLRSLAALLLLAACEADPPANAPLPPGESNRGYTLADLNLESGRADIIVLAAFSGGGMRSAGFAHGALHGMAEVAVPGGTQANGAPRGTTLLDELDQLSAVSGGSYAAAHYALHRRASLARFTPEFLEQDVEAYVWGTFLLPWNWGWLWNPSVGTNDRMAAVYDRMLFQGATYADLIRLGRPRLSIGATELVTATNFPFLPQPFDLICSDLAQVPLARAVAASAALPVLFTPITLANRRGPGCSSPMPPLPEPATIASDPRMRALNGVMRRLADPEATRYLHLVDGGVADNLGLRYILTSTASGGERGEDYVKRILPIRRLLWIAVDGQGASDPALSAQRVVYGMGRVINAVSGGQVDNYNLETLSLAQEELARIVVRNRALRCAHAPVIDGHPCEDVQGMLVHVALADLPDAAQRARLQAIPTTLTLAPGQARELVEAGRRMMREAPGLAAFLAGL
jgi:NTE family protein